MFKTYKSFLINPGASSANFRDEIKGHLTTQGWQVHSEDVTVPSNLVLRMIPPATETIGNANGFNIAQLEFASNALLFSSVMVGTTSSSYQFDIGLTTYYADDGRLNVFGNRHFGILMGWSSAAQILFETQYNANNVTLNTDNSTITQRRTALYNDFLNLLSTSTLDFFKDHTYAIVTVSYDGSGNPNFTIRATPKPGIANEFVVPTVYGVDQMAVTILKGAYQAGIISKWASSSRVPITLDYGTGFIYYLTVDSRTIQIASKTTVSFYGPIGLTYGDNTSAVAQTPPGLIPVELIACNPGEYTHNLGNSSRFYAGSSHNYGYIVRGDYPTYLNDISRSQNALTGTSSIATLMNISNTLGVNPYVASSGANYNFRDTATPAGVDRYYAANLADLQGLSVVSTGSVGGTQSNANPITTFIIPTVSMPDVYVFTKPAVNESLHLVRTLNGATTLTTAILAGSSDASLALADASAFSTAGSVIVGTEIMSYSGKSGNTLIGLTRALYGTTSAAHAVSDIVYPGLWFVKMNGGALCAGSVKPS